MKQWGGNQNYRPEKKPVEKTRATRGGVSDAASTSVKTERDYRVGKTIAGATNTARQRNLEHIAARKKQQRKNAVVIFAVLALIVVVAVFIGNVISTKLAEREEKVAASIPAKPTVPIIDENVGNNISERVKSFVARLEADAAEYGLKVDHVTLPFQKAREIIVFFEGRGEYYKMTTERGSTVQVEDAERMIRYLDSRGLTPEYVDLRVEGRGYYK